MTELVTAKESTIKEVKVTVKNVIIGKRQLTQRVFKQIQRQGILNKKTGELNGHAWGYVNYFWSDNSYCSDNYLHILWVNSQGELRRSMVPKYRWGYECEKCEHAHKYLITKLPQLYIAV